LVQKEKAHMLFWHVGFGILIELILHSKSALARDVRHATRVAARTTTHHLELAGHLEHRIGTDVTRQCEAAKL
jgi:hypothetical protein